MIKKLDSNDISLAVHLHRQELHGFLSELGNDFLKKFYEVSLGIPEMFTFIDTEENKVTGLVSGVESSEGLMKKIILKDVAGFFPPVMQYAVFHPLSATKMIQSMSYPGFSGTDAELLSIAVDGKSQGKGIGKKLFQKTVDEFKKRKIRNFKVSIYDGMKANTFYTKMGCTFDYQFAFLGKKMNYYKFNIP